jgi:5-methyltetrahydropteroyltriglutamate--homocysteine methyltransferase
VKRSTERILTTHAGSLARPDDLRDLLVARDTGRPYDQAALASRTRSAVAEVATLRIEALNHAMRDIPPERVRFHVCWGSYHGPHKYDLPLRDLVDLILAVRAQGYSIEASNPRHEHEWRVWEDVKLPDGKILIPGVVGHASDFVEHPDLVAERILRYARLVGRENVIAGTDCGLGPRVGHPKIAWAKFEALVEGARRATRQLWGR